MKQLYNFIGLSTETKRTDENIGDKSTFYEVDTKSLYIYYKGVWYNQND